MKFIILFIIFISFITKGKAQADTIKTKYKFKSDIYFYSKDIIYTYSNTPEINYDSCRIIVYGDTIKAIRTLIKEYYKLSKQYDALRSLVYHFNDPNFKRYLQRYINTIESDTIK